MLFARPVSRRISLCLINTSSTSSHLTSDHQLAVRLAKEQDFQDVLKVSQGVYDGRDYLPFVFHRWLKTPGKYMFVGELHGKIIAFQAANVIDGGQTIYCQSFRIHQEYRGKRLSYCMLAEAINQVHRIAPRAKIRYQVLESNRKIEHFSRRLGYKIVMKKWLSGFPIKQNLFALRNLYDEGELHELNREDAVDFVLDKRNFDHILPNKILVVLKEPYELIPANSDRVFIEGDKMFTDLSTDELRHASTPRSLSHGRLLHHVRQQTWICNIYAKERGAFKSHLTRHVMAAVELQAKTERKTGLEVLRATDLDFDVREVFREGLGLEEDFIECVVCYEKAISSDL